MKTIASALMVCVAFAGCSSAEKPEQPARPKVGVFLVKANNELISHCRCEGTFIGAPSQLDCPWCGCGWLFICPKCRKAFSFARAEECDLTWEELAHHDLDGKYGKDPSQEDIEEWIAYMKTLTKDIKPGKRYAYIDGWVFPIDKTDLRFDGFHARHDLRAVPQAAALSDRQLLEETLGSRAYWDERKLVDE